MKKTLVTFGLGALAMYLLDPHRGRQRRALLRDQWVRGKRIIRERAKGADRALGTQLDTQLEPDQALETPPSAYHLGR